MGIGSAKEKAETRRSYEAAIAGLYDVYYDKIARYAYTRIGNRSEAEDIAGEVFLKALDSLGSYTERGIPMKAWLYRIAHNLVVDYLRKGAKRKTVPIDGVQIEADTDPVATAERNIELGRVEEAMKHITKEQREVLRLRFFGGLTSKEVGSLVNKSDGAVREMQRAALESLRKLLVKQSSDFEAR
jgi:RNA polymerase sigma-70 factor (ECF subfamily)